LPLTEAVSARGDLIRIDSVCEVRYHRKTLPNSQAENIVKFIKMDFSEKISQGAALAASQHDGRSSTSISASNKDDDEIGIGAFDSKKEDESAIDEPELETVAIYPVDIEATPVLDEKIPASSVQLLDPYLVTWNTPEDPLNPRNWTFKRKWAAVFVVSLFTFIAPVSSSMVAPALSEVAKDVGITKDFESQMVMSIYVLSYAVGPLLFGPLSEVFGRVRVLQGSNVMYIAFNLACGFATNKSQLLGFRFLAGFGGSAMPALGGGILGDCFVAVSCVYMSLIA
jgi:hypothetical protein